MKTTIQTDEGRGNPGLKPAPKPSPECLGRTQILLTVYPCGVMAAAIKAKCHECRGAGVCEVNGPCVLVKGGAA